MESVYQLRQMSRRELARFGVQDLAYIKPVTIEGTAAFAVHAADGTQIALIDDRSLAYATVRHYDMEPVSVH